MKSVKVILASFFLLLFTSPLFLFGQEPDVSRTLFSHILNGKTIEIFPGIPSLVLPFGMSIHLFMLLLSVVLIAGFLLFALRREISLFSKSSSKKKGEASKLEQNKSWKPKKPAVIAEILVLFVRDDIVYPVMGKKRGDIWLPFFFTQFLFLLIINLLGLVPAFKSATGNINVTSSMAVMVFILIFVIGIKRLGPFGFFKNLFPEGANLPIGIFVALLEFLGLITKSLVLSLRLFANMLAGHLAILSFLVLMFVISPFFGVVALPFAVFTYTLEVLVALIQAFVFTLLSCIYIMMASTPEGE